MSDNIKKSKENIEEQNTIKIEEKSKDTYSYKWWLISDSFLKRAFAVWWHYFVANLIIVLIFWWILMIFMGAFLIGGSDSNEHSHLNNNIQPQQLEQQDLNNLNPSIPK